MIRVILLRHLSALLLATLLAACGELPPLRGGEVPLKSAEDGVIARDDNFIVVIAQDSDTLGSLAQAYLGDARREWWIAEFNQVTQVRPGLEIVIPLKPPNPKGVYLGGYQTVPVLCYHRFSNIRGKLAVTPAGFAAQMEYLAKNGYHVVTLAQLHSFLSGREGLPQRSVVITIDDGYRSAYEVAFPILKKYGYSATIFLYSDFVGAGDALTWSQMQEMTRSGLIEIQPHSKTHGNLALRISHEKDLQYRERVNKEVQTPANIIEERLSTKVHSFAYPYGDTNEIVIDRLEQRGMALGLTVTPGGNGFFANPYMLRRTMIFGEDDMETFATKLMVFARTPSH